MPFKRRDEKKVSEISTNLFTFNHFFEFPFYSWYRHVRHFVCLFSVALFFRVSKMYMRIFLLVNKLQLVFFFALACTTSKSPPAENETVRIVSRQLSLLHQILMVQHIYNQKSIGIVSLANDQTKIPRK